MAETVSYKFTASVWGEIKTKNVRVLAVNPGATKSEFFEVANARPFGTVMPSQAVVDTMFKALDARNSRPSVVVGGINSFTARLSAMMGTKAVTKVASKLYLKSVHFELQLVSLRKKSAGGAYG